MAERGPDGSGMWTSADRRVGLAHRRLSIIDLSDTGAQPMAAADGQYRITFNGEIYNYRALRSELEARGYRFRTQSDTEVLLHLYADRGAEMVHALRGMYAFALWDERRRGLLLARDPFGIKPLYVADDGNTVRVASQVKALLKGGAVDATPSPAGHVGFYLWGHVPEPHTLYKGIRALPAGTTLWIDADGRHETQTFFSVTEELARAGAGPPAFTRGEVHEQLRAALLDSVRHHMVADVPVGVFLSAGIDSSTIAALAKEVGAGDLQTVTLGFEEYRGTDRDEVPIAELMAKHCGSLHRTHWTTRADFQHEYGKLLDAMDQPSTDGVNSYFVSKAAAEAGLKVALSGLGGDELFGGYPSFRQIPRLVSAIGPFDAVPVLGRGFRHVSAPILRQFTSPKYAGILEYGGSFGGAYLLRRGMYMPWELPDLLDGEMVREGWRELQTISRLEQTVQGIGDAHLKVAALETAWYMRNQLMRDADWASMAHSLEVRVPLVDVNLFRTVAALSYSSGGVGKQEMGRTPLKPLPEPVTKREKTGFTVPVREWLTSGDIGTAAGRGLRGWARTAYREFAGETRPVALVFRTGQLGDALMALPTIELIRKEHPKHRLVLLTDRQPAGTGNVSSWDVFRSTGWFDRVLFYAPRTEGSGGRREWISLVRELRAMKIDQCFNLAAGRTQRQAFRDACFFRGLVGVANYHAPLSHRSPAPDDGGRLPRLEPEWRYTLRSVSAEHETSDFSFPVPQSERDQALRAALAEGVDFAGAVLAIGPGSKMPSKVWPLDRFAELGRRLLAEFPNLQLAVFGGAEDAAIGQALCREWGARAHNLAGKLSISGSAAILQKCAGYVGNDTGVMHLAAMSGIPCVAIFSARDYPGRWDPYGKGHVVLRHEVECAGCLLEVCEEFDNKCLKLISVDEAHRATRKILVEALSGESVV